jgi:sensor domain CHASE-containing protein
MVTTRPLLIKDGKHLDKIRMEQKLTRLENYLHLEGERLQRLTLDWAIWDDTYYFIAGNKPMYIESNLQMDTFENNEIDYMFFYDRGDAFLFGKGIDVIPAQLKKVVQNLVVKFEEQDSAFIINTTKGLAYVDIKETYPSSGEGEPNGKLAMVRYIDEAFLNTLEKPSLEIKTYRLSKELFFP